jgi:hypothetical protein
VSGCGERPVVAHDRRPGVGGDALQCGEVLQASRIAAHQLLAGASWIDEFGDPDLPEEWACIAPYSPYQNAALRLGYPPIFFYTYYEEIKGGQKESAFRTRIRVSPLALKFFTGLAILLLPPIPLALRRTVPSPETAPRNLFVAADQLLRRVRGLRFGSGYGFRCRRSSHRS